MKKLLNIKLSLLLLSILFTSMSCKEKEKEPDTTYYDVVGVGYVFMCDSLDNLLYPIQGAEGKIITTLEGRTGNFIQPDPKEFFISDAIGKYQVRFIKRTDGYDAKSYDIVIDKIGWFRRFTFSTNEVKNAQNIIVFDTLKLNVNSFLNKF